MEATGINKSVYAIKQDYKYLGDDYWSWRVWVDAPPEALNNINYVTYILTPHFFASDQRCKRQEYSIYAEGNRLGHICNGY
jgi:hypothetical protein